LQDTISKNRNRINESDKKVTISNKLTNIISRKSIKAVDKETESKNDEIN